MSAKAKKLGRILTTDAEMREAIRIARVRERTATKFVAAKYDRKSDSILADLSTGVTLSVPRSAILGFAKADPRLLSDIEIVGARETLWSDSVDDGVLIEQLIVIAAGKEMLGSLGARINASKKSAARASASRANGTKGGRPKKSATAA